MHPYTQLVVDLVKTTDRLYQLPRIDYYTFRDKWLPLFNASSNNGLSPLGEWIQGVAYGNAYMEVEVVKGGRIVQDELFPDYTTIEGGEVMFIVPSILNRDLQVSLVNDRVIDNVVVEAQRLREKLVVEGENFYNTEFLNNISIEEVGNPKLLEKMNEIFEHFGIKRTTQMESSNKTESSNIVENPSSETTNNDLLDLDF